MECVRALWTRCSLEGRRMDGKDRHSSADELLETALAVAIACCSPPERHAPRRMVSVLRHDDAPAGYPRSTNIADVTAVPRLLSVVAARAGGLLNFADLSRSVALPQTTLKRYFACWKGLSWYNCCAPGRESGQTGHSNSEVLLERHWIACLLAWGTVDVSRQRKSGVAC